MKRKISNKSRGQVWIESVTYTLIVLALIGAVLYFVKPKLEDMQDKAVLDQTIELMNYLDDNMNDASQGAQGNVRTPEFTLKKGEIVFDFVGNNVSFIMDNVRTDYSEPGREILVGRVYIKTINRGKLNTVTLTIDYNNETNLYPETGTDGGFLTVTRSSTLQKLSFKNSGKTSFSDSSVVCPVSPDKCEDDFIHTRDYCNTDSNRCVYQDTRPIMKIKII